MYLHAFHKRLISGFTLVEMSIVLVIISLLAASGLVVGTTMIERAAYVDTDKILDQLDESLRDYYIVNGRLPCPASVSTLPGASGFGVETACSSGAAVAGTDHFNTANGGVRMGMIPVRTLGLNDRSASDKYGSRIIYAVSESLTEKSSFGAALGAITIVDAANNDILDEAAYALYSHGRDRNGSFAYSNAALISACPAAVTLDKMNCEFDDGELRDAPYNRGDVTASYFDDLIRWAPKYHLMAQETQSTSLWAANGDNIYSVGVDSDTANTKVGIGTSNPQYELHLDGTMRIDTSTSFFTYLYNDNAPADYQRWAILDNSNNGTLAIKSRYPDWTEKSTFLSMEHATGNVGIGTLTPTTRLHVSGGPIYVGNMWLGKSGDTTIAPDIHMSESGLMAANDSLNFIIDGDNDGSDQYFHFYRGGLNLPSTKVLSFDKEGNILLGRDGTDSYIYASTATNQRLVLRGGPNIDNNASLYLHGKTYAGSHPGAIILYSTRESSNGDYALALYNYKSGAADGLMRIETDGDGWMKGTMYDSSDMRLKHDIKPVENALEKLQSIRGVSFRWNEKSERDDLDVRRMGVIAQEVQAVFPELVGKNEEGYLTVNVNGLAAPLIEAVKELKAENNELRAANEEMRGALAELKNAASADYNPLADYRLLLAMLATMVLSAGLAIGCVRKR